MSSSLSPSAFVSLLERLREPTDQEAWRRFVQLYSPLLYSWARRLGFRQEKAADQVQDVFVLLVQKLREFRHDGQGRFRGWLWTVFRNRCWEQKRRHPDVVTAAVRPDLDEMAQSDDEAVWVDVEHRRQLVRWALEIMRVEFPETTWRACWEYVARDRTPAAVARDLGISIDSVYQAKTRE